MDQRERKAGSVHSLLKKRGNPTVNTATPAEKKLALVVAAHLKAGKEAK